MGLDQSSQAEWDRVVEHLHPPWGAESPLQSCQMPLWWLTSRVGSHSCSSRETFCGTQISLN